MSNTRFNVEIMKENNLTKPRRGRKPLYPFHELKVNYGFKVNDRTTKASVYSCMYSFMQKNPNKQFKMFITEDNCWFFKRVK